MVHNVLSPRDLVSRPDNMDETVLHTRWGSITPLPLRPLGYGIPLSSSVVYICTYITKTCPCNIQQFLKTVKMIIFSGTFLIFFLIFAQNIDCGYTLEPPH